RAARTADGRRLLGDAVDLIDVEPARGHYAGGREHVDPALGRVVHPQGAHRHDLRRRAVGDPVERRRLVLGGADGVTPEEGVVVGVGVDAGRVVFAAHLEASEGGPAGAVEMEDGRAGVGRVYRVAGGKDVAVAGAAHRLQHV